MFCMFLKQRSSFKFDLPDVLSHGPGMFWSHVDPEVSVCLQLAQSVIELNNQIQQKDKEILNNEAR